MMMMILSRFSPQGRASKKKRGENKGEKGGVSFESLFESSLSKKTYDHCNKGREEGDLWRYEVGHDSIRHRLHQGMNDTYHWLIEEISQA